MHNPFQIFIDSAFTCALNELADLLGWQNCLVHHSLILLSNSQYYLYLDRMCSLGIHTEHVWVCVMVLMECLGLSSARTKYSLAIISYVLLVSRLHAAARLKYHFSQIDFEGSVEPLAPPRPLANKIWIVLTFVFDRSRAVTDRTARACVSRIAAIFPSRQRRALRIVGILKRGSSWFVSWPFRLT